MHVLSIIASSQKWRATKTHEPLAAGSAASVHRPTYNEIRPTWNEMPLTDFLEDKTRASGLVEDMSKWLKNHGWLNQLMYT